MEVREIDLRHILAGPPSKNVFPHTVSTAYIVLKPVKIF